VGVLARGKRFENTSGCVKVKLSELHEADVIVTKH